MRIVELSDYTMVIIKDSDDSTWFSMSEKYEACKKPIVVWKDETNYSFIEQKSSDSICTAGRLILFFSDKVKSEFKVGDKVNIS